MHCKDGDGRLSLEEFKDYMEKLSKNLLRLLTTYLPARANVKKLAELSCDDIKEIFKFGDVEEVYHE